MQRKFGSVLFLGVLLLVMAAPTFAARGYEGYNDSVAASPWFDGAKSTIDYQDVTVGSIGTAAWCGIDNNGTGGWGWIQGGWVKWKNSAAQIYWEYIDKDGNYDRGYDQAPGASETYEQSHTGSNAEWKHGATVYKTVAWSKFAPIEFRKVYYGAEMVDAPADHTPGKAASKNNFVSSQARRAGGGFAVTGLNSQAQPTADQGNVEKYGGDDSGNFRTWDSRND
jgi:hypothetical protein